VFFEVKSCTTTDNPGQFPCGLFGSATLNKSRLKAETNLAQRVDTLSDSLCKELEGIIESFIRR